MYIFDFLLYLVFVIIMVLNYENFVKKFKTKVHTIPKDIIKAKSSMYVPRINAKRQVKD